MPLLPPPTATLRLMTTGATVLAHAIVANLPLVSGGNLVSQTSSLNADSNWRSKGNFTRLYCLVTANSLNTTSTGNLRINDTTAVGSVSIPATSTGDFTDTTSVDPINFATAVQSMNVAMTTGGTGTQTITINALAINFTPTAANLDSQRFGATQTSATFTGSTSAFFVPICGDPAGALQVEANVQVKFKNASTLQRLYLRVSANTVAATSTLTTRINGNNGTVTVSVGSSATGNFEDTTHSDAVNPGDLVNLAMVLGASSGTLTLVGIGLDSLTTLTGYSQNLSMRTAGVDTTNNSTGYFYAQGGVGTSNTESNVQVPAGIAYTASNMAINVLVNDTSTSTLTMRMNAVSGFQAISIGPSATGYFEDTVNTDSIEPSYEVNYALVVGATGSFLRANYLSHVSKFTFPSRIQNPQALRPRISAPGLAR